MVIRVVLLERIAGEDEMLQIDESPAPVVKMLKLFKLVVGEVQILQLRKRLGESRDGRQVYQVVVRKRDAGDGRVSLFRLVE